MKELANKKRHRFQHIKNKFHQNKFTPQKNTSSKNLSAKDFIIHTTNYKEKLSLQK